MTVQPRHLAKRISECLYVDIGRSEATTFVSGMGRSGTTWVGAVINHDFSYRMLFEPLQPDHALAAKVFGPFAYVRPADRDPARIRAAEKILSGRTPRGVLDRGHRGRIFRRRIVKEVRSNLMLGWLKAIRPVMPLVLVVRNPFSVAASWVRLKWGVVAGGTQAELDVILDQQALLDDFPVIRGALAGFDRSDAFERVVFQWCVLHLVPLQQLRAGEAHLICYENMIREPVATVGRLADYLNVRIGGPSLDRALATMKTDFLRRGSQADRADLMSDWKTVLSARQIEHGHRILDSFGLDHLYDENGLPSAAIALGG